MSDEEKAVLKTAKENYGLTNAEQKILVNLIEKQSKEIEEYKKQLDLDYVDKHFVPIERYNQLEKEIEELKEKNKYLPNWVSKKYVSKDEIKAKIEYCREILYSFEKELELKANKDKFIHKESMNCLLGQISILQSLLEKE